MNSQPSLCPTCWAEGQRPGKPCWLCHSTGRRAIVEKPTSLEDGSRAPGEAEPFVATAVEVPIEAVPFDTFPIEADPNNPYSPPSVAENTGLYRLSSVLLVGALIFVCVLLSIRAPGLGIPVSIIVLPALIRTVVVSKRNRIQGTPLTSQATVSTFFFSAAAAVAASVAAAMACIGAFLSACLVVCFGAQANVNFNDELFVFVIGICLLASIGFGIFLFLQLTKSSYPSRDN